METSTYESGNSQGSVQTLSPSLTDRQWAAAAHAAALLFALLTSWVAGIAGAVAALVVWMLVRDKSPFASEHAREALNFNLSMFIYAAIAVVLVIFTLGLGLIVALPMWVVLALVWSWADRHYGTTVPSFYSLLQLRGTWFLLLAAVFMAAMSVVGDLVESLIKRSVGVKDSSGLLPGHGGVLDRIDALLPTLPLAMMLSSLVHS